MHLHVHVHACSAVLLCLVCLTFLVSFFLPSFSSHVHVGDLWASLEEASQKPVAEVMSTWTQQLGYPVLSVEAKQVHEKMFWMNALNFPHNLLYASVEDLVSTLLLRID